MDKIINNLYTGNHDLSPCKSNKMLSQEQQSTMSQFISLMKNGCNKQFCFMPHCSKNIIGKFIPHKSQSMIRDLTNMSSSVDPISQKVQSEVEMEVYARAQLDAAGEDADELICTDTPTCNRNDLRNASAGKHRIKTELFWLIISLIVDVISTLILDYASFCCSFRNLDST